MLRRILLSHTFRRRLSASSETISINTYQEASENTLEELSEHFESILEDQQGADVSLNSGVLTVTVDPENTFVINKHTQSRQIWLSSPVSGPAKFSLVSGRWIDTRRQLELKELLLEEISNYIKTQQTT